MKFIRPESVGITKSIGEPSMVKSLIKTVVRKQSENESRFLSYSLHTTATPEHSDSEIQDTWSSSLQSYHHSPLSDHHHHINRSSLKSAERCSMLCNSTSITSLLDNLIYNYTVKLRCKAYVHWYDKHGIDEYTMIDALDSMIDVNDRYRSIINDKMI